MSYKFNPFTGELDYFEEAGEVSSIAAAFIVEQKVLSPADALAKEVTLDYTPTDPTKTLLDIVGGSNQIYLTDFTVVGDVLSWDGLGLDLTLSAGDTIRVTYPL